VEKARAKPVILRLVVILVVLGGLYYGLATFLSHHLPSNATAIWPPGRCDQSTSKAPRARQTSTLALPAWRSTCQAHYRA